LAESNLESNGGRYAKKRQGNDANQSGSPGSTQCGINGPAHSSAKNHHRDDAPMVDEALQLKKLRIGPG